MAEMIVYYVTCLVDWWMSRPKDKAFLIGIVYLCLMPMFASYVGTLFKNTGDDECSM